MKNALKIQWKACSIPKLGNTPEENEDAFSPELEQQTLAGQEAFRCAISDGATQTSFSRTWAGLLVAAAVQDFLPERLADLTAAAQTQWKAHLSTLTLPWHAEEKVRQGAFATLLWLGLQPAPGGHSPKTAGTWRTLAIGDSCLFHIRKKSLLTHFPPLSVADFKNDPLLLSSNPTRNASIWSGAQDFCASGDWAAGDDFLLMTDALAAWFLREQEKTSLASLQTQLRAALLTPLTFNRWLEELRASAAIKNDDTTIIWIHMGEKQD